MKVLGIESSCDETAAAVVVDGRLVLSNAIFSQIAIHAQYGGVVPEVASRQHTLSIIPILRRALDDAGVGLAEIDAVAVTRGPGLVGSLLVGLNVAKGVAFQRGLPLIGVNHLEGHIYANWLIEQGPGPPPPQFPLICLVVSGAHSDLVLMTEHEQYQLLGRSLDDAAGEAFDKVSRLLGLGYPGGPAIQRVAASTEATPFHLPRAWLRGTYDFSFSGLKTAVLHMVQKELPEPRQDAQTEGAPERIAAEIAAAFQESVVDVLATKTVAAAKRHRAKEILLAGGVAANKPLRERIIQTSPIPVHVPRPIYCTDNAAMIASAGYFKLSEGRRSGWDLDVTTTLKLV
ncbi:MAG: tRNA (adenosine(37)-N6)-threonylcarbamoyltransferase complex transferase subunit TsaD [Chloroflexota bacterium]|nr:MAG: tRNA (adenosine(37)-N6)-threonylcarbamoyltransferase complex transferase subunit TsaD [Chloroflexota bacterium]